MLGDEELRSELDTVSRLITSSKSRSYCDAIKLEVGTRVAVVAIVIRGL